MAIENTQVSRGSGAGGKIDTADPSKGIIQTVMIVDATGDNVLGVTANPLQVDVLSGGGGGDASAANQVTLQGLIGEVGVAPTENTVLERLQALETAILALAKLADTQPVADSAVATALGDLATQATLVVAAADTTSIDGKTPSLGQSNKLGSVPVTLASDEDPVAVSATALPLPSGAATDSTLSTMSGKLPASLGSKASAESLSFTLASNEGDLAVTLNGEAVVLGTGSAVIGKLDANSGVDIGDVDVTSLPDANLTTAKMGSTTTDRDTLTTGYVTYLDLSAVGDAVTTIRQLRYSWTGDTELVLSFDGSTDHHFISPYESGTIDFYAMGLSEIGDVRVKYNGASNDPSAGALTLTAVGV